MKANERVQVLLLSAAGEPLYGGGRGGEGQQAMIVAPTGPPGNPQGTPSMGEKPPFPPTLSMFGRIGQGLSGWPRINRTL